MKAEEFMETLGGISENHIAELVAYNMKKARQRKIIAISCVAVAAVLLIVGAILTNLLRVKGNIYNNVNYYEELGGKPEAAYGIEPEAGQIHIHGELALGMKSYGGDGVYFVVGIKDYNENSAQDIYDEFVAKLGVKEEFLEKGLLYMTADEIKNITTCPDNMKIEFWWVRQAEVEQWKIAE